MPRRKKELTPEQRQAIGAEAARRFKYYADHPEENAKRLKRMHALEQRGIARRMAKFQPEIVDIQADGRFVTVYFTRFGRKDPKVGERVSGTYELSGGSCPLDMMAAHRQMYAKEQRAIARLYPDRSKDKAASGLPPDPGEKPRS